MKQVEIAAWLLRYSDGLPIDDDARAFIRNGRTAAHDGDCTNQCHTCQRCLTEQYLKDARSLLRALGETSPTEKT